MNKLFTLMLCLCCPMVILAQQSRKPQYSDSNNKGKATLFHFNFGAHLPAGNMAQRFGWHQSVGGALEHITVNNLIFGIQGHYLFSQNVKDDPLASLRTPEGDIIGIDQGIASLVLRERGFYVGGHVGRMFVFDPQKRSGLRTTLGAGWLQHWIRLQDDAQTVPIVSGEYSKGFDRLTAGLALNEFVGWQHMSKSRRINWYVGLEMTQGFTTSQRDYDFEARRKLDGRRLDMGFGVRVGWILPIYHVPPEDIYY